MRSLDVVVPSYNESQCVELLYKSLKNTLDKQADLAWNVIFVDDGSTDDTLDKIKKIGQTDNNNRVQYISFSRNFGKESAIFAGLSYSTADYVVLMDADLQHPPEILPQMLDALDSGYDCCGAKRVTRGGEPPVRSFLSKCFYKLTTKFMDVDLSHGGSDFHMMKRHVIDAMLSMPEKGRFTKGIMAWVGFNTKWIDYENVERVAGTTKWSVRSLTAYAIDGILSFASNPFMWAVWAGLAIDIIAVIAAIVLLFVGTSITAYLFLLLAFIFGTMILMIGIIGEYLVKIYTEVKNRPLFIIKDTSIK